MRTVYDPAQARIEAESVKAIMEKYPGSDDGTFQQRCVLIKEERAELVKHHLWCSGPTISSHSISSSFAAGDAKKSS